MKTTMEPNLMIKQTLNEWRAEARERFGENGSEWQFVCPKCRAIQSAKDFVNAGCKPENAANSVYQECIGRTSKGKGCDWAAYGFLGTLGKGRIVVTPEGNEVEVFDFAD